MVFLDIKPRSQIPEHSYGEQWGVVIVGEIELVVDSVKKVYRKGDCYRLPPEAIHSATFRTRLKAIDIFADVHRYKPKPQRSMQPDASSWNRMPFPRRKGNSFL